MFIYGMRKDDNLIDVTSTEDLQDLVYKKFKAENHTVVSWLINLMCANIVEKFLIKQNIKFRRQQHRHCTKEKSAKIFEIAPLNHDLKQVDMLVNQYYNALTKYW